MPNTKFAKVNQNGVKRHPEKEFSALFWVQPQNWGRNGINGHNPSAKAHDGKQSKPVSALPSELKNRIDAFVLWESGSKPGHEIKKAVRRLGREGLEALWADLRLEENRAHAEWIGKFRALNPGVRVEFVERGIEQAGFSDFKSLLSYISRGYDKLGQAAEEHLIGLQAGKSITINGRKNIEYMITKTDGGWLCAKKDCHLELDCENVSPENLGESKKANDHLIARLEKLDALFIIARRRLLEHVPREELPDRNSGTIRSNLYRAIAMVSQSQLFRSHFE